jgi:hypothetical protein
MVLNLRVDQLGSPILNKNGEVIAYFRFERFMETAYRASSVVKHARRATDRFRD